MHTDLTDFIKFCDETLKNYTDQIKSDSKNDILTLAKNTKHNVKLAQDYLKNGIYLIQEKANTILNNQKNDNSDLKKELEKVVNDYINRNTDFI